MSFKVIKSGTNQKLTYLNWTRLLQMPKNLGRHVTLVTPLFKKFLRGNVQTVPSNMPLRFEVCSFNHFGAISI